MSEEPIDYKAKAVFDKISSVIEQMESGEIKPGDVVYCSKALKDVIFVEKPPEPLILEYHEAKRNGEKFVPFTGDVKYRTFSGQICSVPVGCISKILKGNKFVEHEVKGYDSDSINYADLLEYYARGIGYRVERIDTKNGIKLTFFGDNQEELDKFLVQCCHKGNIFL